MHDALLCDRRFRTFNVVDDYKREELPIEIDLNIPAHRVIRMLDLIVDPLKMRMDNGPELVLLAMAQWAEEHGVQLEFIKQVNQHKALLSNGSIEDTGQKSWVYYLFRTLNEAREIKERWPMEYNFERPH